MAEEIKNEHFVWALGETKDGSYVMLAGITDAGLEFLKDKKTLLMNPPKAFPIKNVVIFYEPTKDDIKKILAKTGLPIKEEDLNKL